MNGPHLWNNGRCMRCGAWDHDMNLSAACDTLERDNVAAILQQPMERTGGHSEGGKMGVYVNREVGISVNVGRYQLEIRNGGMAAKLSINQDGSVLAESDLDADDVRSFMVALQEIQALTE